MRLKVTKLEDGLHPSQVSVSINAIDGRHYLVINKMIIDSAGTIDIGHPVGRRGEDVLVELPNETDSGRWRVWVRKDGVTDNVPEAVE